jgi:sensor histidine kinase YesM
MTAQWQHLCRWCGTRPGRLVCWFGAFGVLAMLEAVQMYAGQGIEGITVTWGTAIRRAVEAYSTISILGLGVVWLARRFPFGRSRVWPWVALHLGFALLYAVTYALIYSALLHGQMSVRGKAFEFGETLRKLLIFYTFGSVGFYWLLLLGNQGWHYYQRYRERERRAAELEGQLARAQLQALRMQLNPHFLFNTLNTITALIHDQPDLADRTVTRLSELLRLSLDRTDTHEIPLREELGFLQRYLEIEQARFGDRLRVDFVVPAEVEDAYVPALLLQPIVENAIRHGIERREEAGHISLRARQRGQTLELVVSDNGPGLPPGQDTFPREGIGLANTRSRLRHLYGECQSLQLSRAEPEGLEVRMTLPLRTLGDPVPQPGGLEIVVGCHPSGQRS